MAEYPSTLSCLADILELGKRLIIWIAYKWSLGEYGRHLLYLTIASGNWYSMMIIILSRRCWPNPCLYIGLQLDGHALVIQSSLGGIDLHFYVYTIRLIDISNTILISRHRFIFMLMIRWAWISNTIFIKRRWFFISTLKLKFIRWVDIY